MWRSMHTKNKYRSQRTMLDDDDDDDDFDDDDNCNDQHSPSNVMMDFFDHEPTIREKIEMRKASKPPSEWLNLLCREWAIENQVLVETADAKFLDYKPYLKGLVSSQLLCRLSIPTSNMIPSSAMKMNNNTDENGSSSTSTPTSTAIDFWEILGISDAFDRAYIVAQIERFCSLYSIRAISLEDISEQMFASDDPDTITTNMNISPSATATVAGGGIGAMSPYMDSSATTNFTAPKRRTVVLHKTIKTDTNSDQLFDYEQRQHDRREHRRMSNAKKEQKHREKEECAARKAADRAVRETEREERRRRKIELREQREKFAQEQKEAALKRAAELVTSNRVPIEITRGVAAAKAAQLAIQAGTLGQPPMILTPPPETKKRSAVMVSTASDLNQIVIHSKNLWAKYNAIAKEHNQKVNWITVARELGINVKVREKYARMHARAERRGFDWINNGHWKIKNHPEIFLEPTLEEQKAKIPPPPPDSSQTVLISSDDAIAAAAAVVVDASVTFESNSNHTSSVQLSSNPSDGLVTAPLYASDDEDAAMIEPI